MTSYLPPTPTRDVSSQEVEPKDFVDVRDSLAPDFTPFKSDFIRLRVASIDLDGLVVETDAGLCVGLEPSKASFFQQSLDDDTSYKLLCTKCLHRVVRGFGASPFLRCSDCGHESPYEKASTGTLWLPEGGVRLSVQKAEVRQERSNGAFPVNDPEALNTYLKGFDFIAELVRWLEPYGNPFEAHPRAWDLADMLDEVWTAWKTVRRNRREGKRLSAFRSMEALFNDGEYEQWTRHPALATGVAVPEKVKKK